MKRILSYALIGCLLAFQTAGSLFAQGADARVSAFTERVKGAYVCFDFVYSVRGDFPLEGMGSAGVYAPAYIVRMGGLEILCDGKERWTVDRQAQEAVVETVGGTEDILMNPAALIGSLDSAFQIAGPMLFPKDKTSQVEYVKLSFGKDGCPSHAQVRLRNGGETHFALSGWTFAQEPPTGFPFDAKALTSQYILTDLR